MTNEKTNMCALNPDSKKEITFNDPCLFRVQSHLEVLAHLRLVGL